MILIALLSLWTVAKADDAGQNPDVTYNFIEMCVHHGYLVEVHNVTTADGYILTLYRIPGKAGEAKTSNKPVAFLQHGLIDLSDTWIMNIPSPGFMMADDGFDVWFGNSRGSYHSLGHVKYNPWKDALYWNFTWQDMAEFDIPAVIPYVLKATGKEKLTYIGHSQGTLQMFAHLSENPDFMKHISLFVALAPVGTVRRISVELLQLFDDLPLFHTLELFGINCFLPNIHEPSLFYDVCSKLSLVCKSGVYIFADMEVAADNLARMPVILSHEPGGTSMQNMRHWQQMVGYSEYKVQKFDFGAKKNEKIYGTRDAPQYDFTKIPGPIALFFGTDDRLADSIDGNWLRDTIPASSVVYTDIIQNFGHLTFLWGKDMSYFDGVMKMAKDYAV